MLLVALGGNDQRGHVNKHSKQNDSASEVQSDGHRRGNSSDDHPTMIREVLLRKKRDAHQRKHQRQTNRNVNAVLAEVGSLSFQPVDFD